MEKISIVILGSSGMLGHMVYEKLSLNPKFKIYPVSRSKTYQKNNLLCDVENKNNLYYIIEQIKPKYIINCIGLLVEDSKKFKHRAVYINSFLPHFLNELSEKLCFKLIHISTDCVFSGKKGYYNWDDAKDSEDFYGKTKALGEFEAYQNLIIRTSIIGPEIKQNGTGLMFWFFNQKEANGFIQSIWSGVTTLELAKVIEESILKNFSGLFQITNNSPISKWDLLNKINTIFNHNIPLIKIDGKKSDKSLRSNCLDKISVPSYDIMLEEMKSFIYQPERKNIYHNLP